MGGKPSRLRIPKALGRKRLRHRQTSRSDNSRISSADVNCAEETEGRESPVISEHDGTSPYKNYPPQENFDELRDSCFSTGDIDVDYMTIDQYMIRMAYPHVFSSPVDEMLRRGGRVLDVCCGTGALIIELALEYPNTEFVGMDTSPGTAPDDPPSNVRFVTANVLDGWPFPDDHFDLVHIRALKLKNTFTTSQWHCIIDEAARITKTNGWVEVNDVDVDFFNAGPITRNVISEAATEMIHRNVDISIIRQIPQLFTWTRKLAEIRETRVECKIGRNGGLLGQLQEHRFFLVAQKFADILASRLGISKEQFIHETLQRDLMPEFEIYPTSCMYCRIFARKL